MRKPIGYQSAKIDIAIAADDGAFTEAQMAELYSSLVLSLSAKLKNTCQSMYNDPLGWNDVHAFVNKACPNASPTQVAFQNHE